MTQDQVIGAINRSSVYSLAYHGPVNENGLVDPWNPPCPANWLGLQVPIFAARTDYVREPKSGGTSHAWGLCAAEVVLANEVPNWSDFFNADVKYAILKVPTSQELIMVWVWFNRVRRVDNCFAFAFNTRDLDHRAWLVFLWRSKKLLIRNGPKASGVTNVVVNLEQGGALNFLHEKLKST